VDEPEPTQQTAKAPSRRRPPGHGRRKRNIKHRARENCAAQGNSGSTTARLRERENRPRSSCGRVTGVKHEPTTRQAHPAQSRGPRAVCFPGALVFPGELWVFFSGVFGFSGFFPKDSVSFPHQCRQGLRKMKICRRKPKFRRGRRRNWCAQERASHRAAPAAHRPPFTRHQSPDSPMWRPPGKKSKKTKPPAACPYSNTAHVKQGKKEKERKAKSLWFGLNARRPMQVA